MDTVEARRWIKQAAATLFHYGGLRRAVGAVRRSQAGGRRVVIIAYHRVVEDFTGEVGRSIPGTLISKETLRRQLEDARALGFDFGSMSQAVEVLAGRRRAPRDLLVVTFDDGYRDVYRHAFPVLKALGIPFTVYLPSGFIGTDRRFNHDRLYHLIRVAQARGFKPVYDGLPPAAAVLLAPIFSGQRTASAALDDFLGLYPAAVLTQVIDALSHQLGGGDELVPQGGEVMTWDEVRELARAGVEIGAHTVGHCVLTVEPLDRVAYEIAESKRRIEAEIGRPVEHFAYCNGWYSEPIIEQLARSGFRSAVTTEDGLNRLGGDPFTLQRKCLWESFSMGALGQYSAPLIGCQLDDVFGFLNLSRPVVGRRPQRVAQP